ncbi:MAG TPA: lysylphosphatidylglycerol synthase transmembrane domain-containing protein [Sedimentisphaerales bacterium]|nr:lysylphosphatidylglycerol synthase transmembrane domain-containing protein [Sedimentisphaerales bacterium]
MPESKNSKSKKVFLFLRIAFVLAGIAFGVHWLNTQQAWARLVQIFSCISIVVFAVALAIFTIGHVTVTLRWWLLLRAQAIFIPLSAAVKLYFLGWFYNNFMPGSVGGDLIRAWYVTRHTDKKLEAVLSVFVDRAIGLLTTLIIAAFFYTLFLRPEGRQISFQRPAISFSSLAQYWRFLLVALLVIAALLVTLYMVKPGRALLQKISSSVRLRILNITKKTKTSAILYCKKPLTILQAFVLTVFVQISTITGFWLLGRNLGIEASIKYYYVFFTLVWVIGTVPVSIGGAVVMEGTLAWLFVHFAGVDAESALALALCQRFVWMITSLPGAVIHLVGAHLPADLSLDLPDG